MMKGCETKPSTNRCETRGEYKNGRWYRIESRDTRRVGRPRGTPGSGRQESCGST